MTHCEEDLLKSVVERISSYAQGHPDDASFYRDIWQLEELSVQRYALGSDLEFFDSINKLLGVITTIIVHPHIMNARESIIVRAEQAHGITPEMFLDTIRDEKLWKDKAGVMTPAEVYYFQNIDDLANYENRFVVYLIDLLGRQLAGYEKFYDFLVGTLNHGNRLTQEQSLLERAYEQIDKLEKKLRRIRRTEFYRIVSKANTRFTRVEPTNIFKHNRAYGECYRFYLRNLFYGEGEARANDLAVYVYSRLLVGLMSLGYTHVDGGRVGDKRQIIRPMSFENDHFIISVERAKKYNGLYLNITSKALGESARARNLLVVDSTVDFSEVGEQIDVLQRPGTGVTAVDAVNLWDAAYVDDAVRLLGRGGVSENVLLRRYLEDKTRMLKGSRRIYSTHCPDCGSKSVASADGVEYTCPACGTGYKFVGESIWFHKLRRI